MANITPPKAQVPIGLLTIAGQEFEVRQHPEIVRFFFDIGTRIGGTTALTNTQLQTLTEQLSAINPPSEVAAQAAERLAEDLHAQIASLRGSLDDAIQRCDELSARLEEIARVPDLTFRVTQIEERLN